MWIECCGVCRFDGWVVCEEHRESLVCAWEEEQAILQQKEFDVCLPMSCIVYIFIVYIYLFIFIFYVLPFCFPSVLLTLLVGRHEGHLACKKFGVGLLVVMI